MNVKTCPYCDSKKCVRKGFQDGHQRWKCTNCGKKFQANKTAPVDVQGLFCLYVFNKQTLTELSDTHSIRTKDIQLSFDEVVLPAKVHTPRPIALTVDATFFGSFCVIVLRDAVKKENLWWAFAEDEYTLYYERGKNHLLSLGYTFVSVTADGLPGLPSVFNGIPFQYCHFHAKKNVTKYLTRKPKTDAGIALRHLMETIHLYTEESFRDAIDLWHIRYKDFLDEKTYHPDGSWSHTHRRLVSALRSMRHMLPYLFTYQKYTARIPRTTNTLEGFFRHLKIRVSVHMGLSTYRKQKLIAAILLYGSSRYNHGMEKVLFRS